MKKILILLTVFFLPALSFASNGLDLVLKEFYSKNSVKGDSSLVDDYTWIRRVYIDLAGRIPKIQEIDDFLKNKNSDKKQKLVDKILSSEDYVNNYYNFWADLFRIRPERLSDDVGLLKSYPYMGYLKKFIRQDQSYKDFVFSLLTAKGRYTDNAATGYMLRDNGMPLDNLATSLQIFIGKDIACAQCHDDPFQDYTQKQFYQMASFFNGLDNRERRKDYGDVIKKIDEQIKDITKKDRIDNNVRQLLSSNLFNLKDDDSKQLKLPHDYKYSDSKPFDVVEPVSLDGNVKNVKQDKRISASEWIVNHSDFSHTISNRLWQNIVGKGLVQTETNFSIDENNKGKILQFIGDYFVKNNYSIKSVLRLITTSDFYSRKAYNKNVEEFEQQSVLVKRMSSYQIWDSLLTLVIPDVNYTRLSFDEYSNLIEIDWNVVNGQMLLDRMKQITEYDRSLNSNFLKYKNIDLVRSSFVLNKNSFVGQFLKEYGSSDRILIDSSNDKGSITQVLTIMNSPIMEILLNKKSQIFVDASKNKDNIILSILSRPASIQENGILQKAETNDVVWALINSREFIFRK
jgi:hypothetical protein